MILLVIIIMGRDFQYFVCSKANADKEISHDKFNEIDSARNVLPLMFDKRFTYIQMKEFIKERLEDNDMQAVRVLSTIMAEMNEGCIAILDSN